MKDEPDFEARDYWEQRLRRLPGIAGVGSLDYSRRYNEWLYRVRKRVFARVVRSLPIDLPQARVLDVGSGTGFYLECWQECGARDVTGSDLTTSAVEDLRTRYDLPVIQLDITEPNDVGAFDIVSVVDVLFHIVDDDRYEAAFQNLGRMVRPGGFLVFSEHLPHRGTYRAPHRVSRGLDEVIGIAARSGFTGFVRKPMFVLMEYPIDAMPGRGQFRRFRLIGRLARTESLGYVIGLVLYPLELLFTRLSRESPSTEFVICRRVESPTSLDAGHEEETSR